MKRAQRLLLLVVVLVGLKDPPYEPLERTDLKHEPLKTTLSLALALAKQVRDIHVLLVHQSFFG